MKKSMADYLLGLFLKYFFRVWIVAVLMLVFFEGVMQIDSLHENDLMEIYTIGLIENILSLDGVDETVVDLVPEVTAAAVETSKVWMLTIFMSLGFGVPLGIFIGRIGCAGKYGSFGWRKAGRGMLAPFMCLIILPAFGLASLIVFCLIDVFEVPVYELMKEGGRGLSDGDARVAGWWRLLLPAMSVSVSASAWLASEVVQIIWQTNQAGFVRNAEDRGLPRAWIFFYYTLNNSICRIGGKLIQLLPVLLGALILVEWVFRFPGLGAMIRDAASEEDSVRLIAAGFIAASMVIVVGFVLEAIIGWIDENTRRDGALNQEPRGDKSEQVHLQQMVEFRNVESEEEGERTERRDHQPWTCQKSGRSIRVKQMSRLKWAWGGIMGGWGARWGLYMLGLLGENILGQVGWVEMEWRRILMGASETLVMAILASILAVFVSSSVAAMAGYMGGWRAYCMIAKTHAAFTSAPVLFWCFVALMVLKGGNASVVLVMGCVGGIMGVGVVSIWFLDMEFRGWIEAAKATGLNRRQILISHFLPFLWPRMIARSLLLLPQMLLLVVAVDFSGLVKSEGNLNRWGRLLAEGRNIMLDEPKLLIFSIIAVCFLALMLAALANWAKIEGRDRMGIDIY